ncbi:60S ribosomal protein L4, partial [Basidiobolus ranarum]
MNPEIKIPLSQVYQGEIIRYLLSLSHPSGLKMSVAARPVINVYSEAGNGSVATVTLPAVFKAPIRPDVVSFVHYVCLCLCKEAEHLLLTTPQ